MKPGPQSPGRTVVILANGLNGYGAVRSAKRAGLGSIVVIPNAQDLSAYSRYPARKVSLPVDEQWEPRLLQLLLEMKFDCRPALIACSDRAASFLQVFRIPLETRFNLSIPDGDIIRTLNDKRAELECMQATGIPVPRSVTRISDSLFAGIPLAFPVIVKPRSFEGYTTLKAKNLVLHSQEAWQHFVDQYRDHLEEFVAQEVVAGDDEQLWVCNATIDRRHRVVRFFSFRRLGTSPSHFGVTSLARSAANPVLRERVQRIASALAYVGPLMMEFKYDSPSGEYLYIETNPRLGMCNWFDTACGVNNVEANCRVASGEELSDDARQTEDMFFVHALADLTARLEDRERLTGILTRYLGLLGVKKVWAVFDLRDPLPFLISTRSSLSIILRRVVRHAWAAVSGKPSH